MNGLGPAPSLTWKSIWEAKSVLKKRVRWKVGNGKSIRIWRDKWISTTEDALPATNEGEHDVETKVSELIDDSTKTWRRDLVYEWFNASEADLICSFPISKLGHPDRLVWQFEKNGRYSIRSAYKFLRARIGDVNVQVSNKDQQCWKRLWQAQLPSKVKVFSWRVRNGFLPMLTELFRKHFNVEAKCAQCGFGYEEDKAKRFIKEANELNGSRLQQFWILAWVVWNDRNNELHKGGRRATPLSANFAAMFMKEFNNAQWSHSAHVQKRRAYWRPPMGGCVKVNFDGSFRNYVNQGGVRAGTDVRFRDGFQRHRTGRRFSRDHQPTDFQRNGFVSNGQYH
ncbi:hypothetical protein PTKIN_Ptkin05aG0073400 [Pterospermum kingtungense]